MGWLNRLALFFFECEHGFFHAPFTSEVFVRCPNSLRLLGDGKEGVLQLMSVVPTSYPGTSLLTEDIGVCHGEDNCLCGRKGKYFTVLGRKPNAEVRGCSDVL